MCRRLDFNIFQWREKWGKCLYSVKSFQSVDTNRLLFSSITFEERKSKKYDNNLDTVDTVVNVDNVITLFCDTIEGI